jgi:hypothetical protein
MAFAVCYNPTSFYPVRNAIENNMSLSLTHIIGSPKYNTAELLEIAKHDWQNKIRQMLDIIELYNKTTFK